MGKLKGQLRQDKSFIMRFSYWQRFLLILNFLLFVATLLSWWKAMNPSPKSTIDFGATTAALAALLAPSLIGQFQIIYETHKTTREWKLPVYKDVLVAVSSITESLVALLGSSISPPPKTKWGRIWNKLDPKPSSRNRRKEDEEKDAGGAILVQNLGSSLDELKSLRVQLLFVRAFNAVSRIDQIDKAIASYMKYASESEVLSSRKVSLYVQNIQIKVNSLANMVSKDMGVHSTSRRESDEDEEANISYFFNYILGANITDEQIKCLSKGEQVLLPDSTLYISWLKAPGFEGIPVMSEDYCERLDDYEAARMEKLTVKRRRRQSG